MEGPRWLHMPGGLLGTTGRLGSPRSLSLHVAVRAHFGAKPPSRMRDTKFQNTNFKADIAEGLKTGKLTTR